MDIRMNKQGSELTVKLAGRLDTITAPDFQAEVIPALEDVSVLVIDLEDLEYISSAGLRVMVEIAKKMNGKGEMKLINLCDVVMDIFTVTGLDSIFNIE